MSERTWDLRAPGNEWGLDLVVTDHHGDPATRRPGGSLQAAKPRQARGSDSTISIFWSKLGAASARERSTVAAGGSAFDEDLLCEAGGRHDAQLVDLERLYHGD